MPEDKKDELGVTSRLHYAQSMYRRCIVVHIDHCKLNSVTVNSVLLVYLFQENKSYGSRKPFAFIL
jgi:hypothetical protein